VGPELVVCPLPEESVTVIMTIPPPLWVFPLPLLAWRFRKRHSPSWQRAN
jgi:hypothetical protein